MEITEIYNTYKDRLTRYCTKKYRTDYDTTNDLVQLTFIKYNKNNNVKYTNTFNYLTYILNSVFIDYYRSEKRRATSCFFEETLEYIVERYTDTENEENNDEKIKLLNAKINKLSPRYKEIINMFYFENLEHKEIAKFLGISDGTSKSNLFKAKKNLKELMQ